MFSRNSIVPPHRKQTQTKHPQPKPSEATKPSEPTTKESTTKETTLTPFQCGDPSHSTYSHTPSLESRIRQHCGLPKVPTTSTDDKGRAVTSLVHRAHVHEGRVAEVHRQAEQRWIASGRSLSVEKTVDQALADRGELEGEDWEVVDAADVDDRWDVRGAFSGKRVRALEEGIQ